MSALFADLAHALPPGERVLWQGRPEWRSLARRAFHLRGLAAYFAVLLAWYAATALSGNQPPRAAAEAILRMAALAAFPLLLIGLYAWVTSRLSVYTITDRRLVLRVGVALPVTVNLPFARIEQAGLRTWADGHGSLTLTLAAGERMAYLVMWPHARPWHLARTQPMLRCIADAERVAQILARALAAAAQMPVAAAPDAAAGAGRVRRPALA